MTIAQVQLRIFQAESQQRDREKRQAREIANEAYDLMCRIGFLK